MPNQLTTLKSLIDRYYARDGLRAPLKAILSKADNPIDSSSTGIINTVYGAAVFDWLARDNNIWSLLPKKPWDQTGFRAITAEPATLVSGVAETGVFPDAIEPTIERIAPVPKWEVTHWQLTEKAKFLSDRDDGFKDTEAFYRKKMAEYHVRGINKILAATASAGVAGDNMECIDRVCCRQSEVSTITAQYAAGEGDIYGLDRDTATTYDAEVTHGAGADGTEVVLTLAMLDETIGKLRQNGAGDRLIAMTGYKTLNKISALCQANFTVMQNTRFVRTLNGVQTLDGVEGGFNVATYNGVPFFQTKDEVMEPDTPSNGLPRIYFLDLDEIYIKLGIPTTYIASDPNEMLLIDGFKSLAAYYTVAELVCNKFSVMCKIRDIKSA